MNKEEKIRCLRKILGNETSCKNDEYIFYCNNKSGCNGKHHRPKLQVNVELDFFHCWVCNFSSKSLFPIFKMGNREDLEKYIDYLHGKGKLKKLKNFQDVILPQEFISLTNKNLSLHGKKAKEYLLSRGLSNFDIIKYKLGYCEDGEYKFRIIIPSFDNDGYLNFFVGRKFYENMGTNYKHGVFSKDIIFNEYLVDWDKPITLTEGPFDSIIGGDNVVPLQGSYLNEESKLFMKIASRNIPTYLALDSDAYKKQIEIASSFLKYGLQILSIDLRKYGYKDIGSMSREKFESIRNNAQAIKTDIDLMRMMVAS